MREYQLAEREFDQALARGEKDGIMAAVANMAEALKALSMDPWSGFDEMERPRSSPHRRRRKSSRKWT